MPLREINAIEIGREIYINYSMKTKYELKVGDVLVCEIKGHFNSSKKLVNIITKQSRSSFKTRGGLIFRESCLS